MIKSKLAIILDSIIISTTISLLLFVWINRLTKNAILSTFFSISLLVLAFITISILFTKRQKNKLSLKSSETHLNNCLSHLQFLDDKSYIKFFEKLFNGTHISNFLFIVNNSYVYINIKYKVFDKDFLIIHNNFLNQNHSDSNLFFITKSYDESFENLLKVSPYKNNIFSQDIISKIMEQKNIFPITKEQGLKFSFKISAKNYLSKKIVFNKKQFKNFFFSGISLLFISLIIPFSFLYLLIGSTMLIFAIICLFKKNENLLNKIDEFLSEIKK